MMPSRPGAYQIDSSYIALHFARKARQSADYDPCAYHAGHKCRKCQAHITDHEYIESGLFMGLCSACLASARQTLRTTST